ncbi:cholecystokinin receptor-like [Ostrea edulis]|uniref:cholecystokinin receptor-like n=1 Tax=Ostrea edulis TaxID=37623 RepID=UPI0024AEBEB3|nr:cholecystokinin receptor-like [Ostrea edulis]
MNSTAEEYNLIFREKMYFNTVLTSVLMFLGVAGNAAALYLYAFRMSRTEDRYFIPFLAAVDLVACVFGCVFPIVINFYRLVFVWEDICKWMYFSVWCTSTLSAVMLFVIAIYRYLKVCRPDGRQMTMNKRRIALLCSVLGSIILSLPLLHFMGQIRGSVNLKNMDINVTSCGLKKERVGPFSNLYFLSGLVLSFINMVCTVALYIPIGLTIYKRFDSIRNSKRIRKLLGPTNSDLSDDRQSDSTSESRKEANLKYRHSLQNVLDTSVCKKKNSHRRRVRHNFTSMFITIVVFYVISYLPTLILIIVGSKDPFKFWFRLDDVSLNILVILKRSYIINHVVNPYIYGYFDLHFRRQFMQSVFICKEQSGGCIAASNWLLGTI